MSTEIQPEVPVAQDSSAENAQEALAVDWQRCLEALSQASALTHAEPREAQAGVRPLDNLFAVSQLRCRIGPALQPDWLARDSVHVAVLGGTNTGKSTVLNLLLGQSLAAMRVTSRYSQFLEAFHHPGALDVLESYPVRFDDYARYRGDRPERQSDTELREHGYRPVVCAWPIESGLADPEAVFWDVPDFSTEEAQIYMRAVMDAAGLADLVLFCVTDESYADDRGLHIFRLLGRAGIPVLLVGNKLDRDDHLRKDIEEKWRDAAGGPVDFLWLPRVEAETAEQRFVRLRERPEPERLRELVSDTTREGSALKRRVLASVLSSLNGRLPQLLAPLAREADAARAWQLELDKRAAQDLYARYRNEYLGGVKYSEYNQTLVRLLELMDFPGIGPVLRGTRKLIALPWQLVRTAVAKIWGSEDKPRAPEHVILEDLIESWLGELRGFAQKQAMTTRKASWQSLCERLGDADFIEKLYEPLMDAYASYRKELDVEIQQRAEAILGQLEKNPTLLAAMRTGNVALNLTVVALAVKSGGLDWSDAVIGPLVSGFMQLAVEYSFEAYLAAQKSALKQFQEQKVRQLLQTYLLDPLSASIPTACTDAELDAVHSAWNRVHKALSQGGRP